MHNQYRITKYDPSLRDSSGAFMGNEWTSYSDVGRIFDGVPLPEFEYLNVEAAYLFSVEAFLREAKIATLQLRGLENNRGSLLPQFIQSQAILTIPQCVEFARFALREIAWGKLVSPGRAYVHFGYDYYMFLGLPSKCPNAISATQGRGLFVESCRSPYLRQRSNPTLKQDAPSARPFTLKVSREYGT
jgi:hypothetical protein